MQTTYLLHSKYRIWLVLLSMCAAMFTVAFNTTALMNALVIISHELHLSPSALQWVINAYLLTCAVFIIVGGQLGDLFGRRNLFLIGTTLFIITSGLIALTHNTTILIGARALQGLSAAIITPLSMTIVKVGFPEELQSKAISIWVAAVGLGFAFGPLMSGIFTTFFSWRDIFWTNIPLMLTATLLARLFAKKSRGAKESIKIDIWGLILLLCGLTPLTLGLIEGNVLGWSSWLTLSLLIGGFVVLIAFWFIEHCTDSPLVNFQHFRKRIFIAGNIGTAVSIFTLLGLLYFFNTFIQNKNGFNYSPLKAGLALLPTSLAMFATSLNASRITNRFGFRLPMMISLLLTAIACYLLHNLSLSSTYNSMWFPLLLFGIGVGISFSSGPALGLIALPVKKAGEGSGIINTMNYYFGVLCIAIGTVLSIHVGRSTLAKALSSEQLSNITLGKIDKAMFGHSITIQALTKQLGLQTNGAITHAAQQALVKSFSSTMLMCMTASILGALCMIFLIRKNKI